MNKDKQRRGGGSPAGVPAALTQAEVEGLTSGERTVRLAWTRRLRATVPSRVAVVSAARAVKAAPPRVTRREMAQIAEGQMPDAVRKRLQRRTRQAKAAVERERTQQEMPDRAPATK